MGTSIRDFFTTKIKKEWKIIFTAAFLIGLAVHLYKWCNPLLNHDSIADNYYSTQNILGSGRWFLSIACGISSFFDLPWINGLLSLLWMSCAAVVVAEIFEIKNPTVLILTGGLLVSFPSVSQLMQYGYTVDGYMLAMLFSALAVYITLIDRINIRRMIIAGVLVCLSCGIYQAYLSFSLLLIASVFILELFADRHETKELLIWAAKQAAVYLGAMICYWIIWKICMSVQGITPNSYLGINKIGFSVQTLKNAIPQTAYDLFYAFFGSKKHLSSVSADIIIYALFFILALFALITAARRTGIAKKPARLVLIICALCAMPFCACIWNFASSSASYTLRMLHCLAVILIFFLVIFEKYYTGAVREICGILTAIMIFNFGLIANISYSLLEKNNQRSYATGTEMLARIHMLDTDSKTVLIAGITPQPDSMYLTIPEKRLGTVSYQIPYDLTSDGWHLVRYLNTVFDAGLTAADSEAGEKITSSAEFREMHSWPASDSIRLIDGIIVIKLSETSDK